MGVRRLQEFWRDSAKPFLKEASILFWPVLFLPSYGVRVFIRDWSGVDRGFLCGLSFAGLIGASVVYGICNSRTVEYAAEYERYRRVASWVAIICLIIFFGSSTPTHRIDDDWEPQI